nr:hypothetical protein [Tanacetum cinerariifolium]
MTQGILQVKKEQPSEVLWVGFPQSLRVDEDSLWNAFSPFGEIEKISAFPGRTYAFIRFKHVNSAIRAKDNLQGQLFNNPRVHITFAKSDSGPSNNQRKLMNDNDTPSPRGRPYGRQGSFDNFRHDNYHETDRIRRRSRSPRFNDNRPIGRFQEMGHDNMFERHSPSRDRMGGFHDLPPHHIPRHNPHQGPIYDDEWDLPEDALVYHGAKKLKSSMVPHEPELPEYPFSESEQGKHVLHQHDMIDNNNLTHLGGSKELQIMECRSNPDQIAYPVFYDVEPTEVRKQSQAFGEAFKLHENKEAAGKWRQALKEAANLAGPLVFHDL